MDTWQKPPVNGVVQPTFHGCTLPPEGYSTTRDPWCYVEGGARCASAVAAATATYPAGHLLEGQPMYWQTCSGGSARVFKGDADYSHSILHRHLHRHGHHGHHHGLHFEGIRVGYGGSTSLVRSHPAASLAPCGCRSSWLYRDGKTYRGCNLPGTSTSPVAFCYVNDGYACLRARPSSNPLDERKWVNCTAPGMEPAPVAYTDPLACQCAPSWRKLPNASGRNPSSQLDLEPDPNILTLTLTLEPTQPRT